jgi:hypothetical protein
MHIHTFHKLSRTHEYIYTVHACVHTYTHMHTHTHTNTCLKHTPTLTPIHIFLTQKPRLTHAHTLSHSLYHTVSITQSLSHSLDHTVSITQSLSHSLYHTVSITQSLSLCTILYTNARIVWNSSYVSLVSPTFHVLYNLHYKGLRLMHYWECFAIFELGRLCLPYMFICSNEMAFLN